MSLFIKKRTLKKTISVLTMITTMVWLSGVSMLAVPVAQAAIVDGDLIKSDAKNPDGTPALSSLDVYIVKLVGTKKFKRLILNPQVFNSYGHLSWGNIQTVSQAVMNEYKTSSLVRTDGDPAEKVYALAPSDDTGSKSWVSLTAEQFLGVSGTDTDSIYTINSTDAGNYTAVTDITTTSELSTFYSTGALPGVTPVPAEGALTAALAADTPASASVPKSAANVYFTKVNFTAGTSDVSITGIKATRSGLGVDANISSVKLFVDGVQKGTSQTLGSSHQATFTLTASPITIPAKTTKAVVIAADIAAATAFDQHVLGIAAASDITTTATVSGTFPVNGNVMTLANVTIGSATLYNGPLHPSSDVGIDPSATGYRLTQLRVGAGSTEGLVIDQITAIKNGTAANTDVKNIELYNDTAGSSLGTVVALDADGRATFSNLNLQVAKGGYVELSVKADMNGGSGRTIAFDLHDGTSYTMLIKGATYGYGITPTRSNFCAANGTCQIQTINQGYLTVSKSASAPATGKIASGGTGTPLMAFDFVVSGEPVNVSQTVVGYTTGTALREKFTNWTLYTTNTTLAGPKNGTSTGAGTETLTFTDAYTLPVGTTVVYIKADVSSNTSANDTIYVSMAAGAVTAKGANSGKTTYTTTGGITVPPATAITGNTMTIQAANLAIVTSATPVAGNMVVNAQDQVFANFDLSASAGGEDVRVSAITVTDTLGGGALTYTGLNNLELWGDPDTSDAVTENVRLETSNSTATNANTVTFTFKTPIVVSKTKSSILTLKADVTAWDVDGLGAADIHTYKINVVGDVTANGKSTGNTLAAGDKSVSGTGQAQTLRASGSLKVEKSADMPTAVQLVSASTGNEVTKYKFSASYEPVDVTEVPIFCGNNAQAGVNCALGNIARIYLYVDGSIIGDVAGYTLNAAGKRTITLDSGTLVVPKDSYKNVTIKIDVSDRTSVTTSSSANIQIGIGDSDGDDTEWGGAGNYNITATGQSSGATITKANIDSLGTGAGNVYGSNGFSAHKGILTVSLHSSSPSGTQTAGANKEVLRLNLTATGDDIIVRELELVNGGTAAISGTNDVTVKSEDLGTTYATVTGAKCNVYNGAGGLVCLRASITPSISIGPNGCTEAAAGATGDICTAGWAAADNLTIAAGATKVVKIFGDTTGSLSTTTYQMSVSNASSNKTTVYGITYRDSSGTDVGNRTGSADSTHPATKNLPLTGGSLTY